METNHQIEQQKSRHSLVTIVIVAGILITIIISVLTLLNCWSMIEYAGWEFEPFLHRQGVKDSYDLVTSLLFGEMIVSVVSTVLILFFFVKLLQWKK